MLSKPAFGARKHAETFKEARVVEDYRHRPTYPESLFVRLAELVDPDSRAVLDVGTGPGDVARPLSLHVDRIDAVDFSEHMFQKAEHSRMETERISAGFGPTWSRPLMTPPTA